MNTTVRNILLVLIVAGVLWLIFGTPKAEARTTGPVGPPPPPPQDPNLQYRTSPTVINIGGTLPTYPTNFSSLQIGKNYRFGNKWIRGYAWTGTAPQTLVDPTGGTGTLIGQTSNSAWYAFNSAPSGIIGTPVVTPIGNPPPPPPPPPDTMSMQDGGVALGVRPTSAPIVPTFNFPTGRTGNTCTTPWGEPGTIGAGGFCQPNWDNLSGISKSKVIDYLISNENAGSGLRPRLTALTPYQLRSLYVAKITGRPRISAGVTIGAGGATVSDYVTSSDCEKATKQTCVATCDRIYVNGVWTSVECSWHAA